MLLKLSNTLYHISAIATLRQNNNLEISYYSLLHSTRCYFVLYLFLVKKKSLLSNSSDHYLWNTNENIPSHQEKVKKKGWKDCLEKGRKWKKKGVRNRKKRKCKKNRRKGRTEDKSFARENPAFFTFSPDYSIFFK